MRGAQVAELWWLLRAAVLHYIRAMHPTEGEHLFNLNTRRAARDNLRKYANSLQRLVILLSPQALVIAPKALYL